MENSLKLEKKKIIRIKGAGSKNLMLKDIILETAQIAFFSLSVALRYNMKSSI